MAELFNDTQPRDERASGCSHTGDAGDATDPITAYNQIAAMLGAPSPDAVIRMVSGLLSETGRNAQLERRIREHCCVPTQWAYDQACAALHKHRGALQRLVELKDGPRDDTYQVAKWAAWENARRALRGER